MPEKPGVEDMTVLLEVLNPELWPSDNVGDDREVYSWREYDEVVSEPPELVGGDILPLWEEVINTRLLKSVGLDVGLLELEESKAVPLELEMEVKLLVKILLGLEVLGCSLVCPLEVALVGLGVEARLLVLEALGDWLVDVLDL